MAAKTNTNTLVISGNLTRQPELRQAGSSTVCHMRLASNTLRKSGDDWIAKPNYFDVVVWGRDGERQAQHLEKGSYVTVTGRLESREWTDKDDNKRQAVDIVAERIEWGSGGGKNSNGDRPAATAPASVPAPADGPDDPGGNS